jgi:hypothetical protein
MSTTISRRGLMAGVAAFVPTAAAALPSLPLADVLGVAVPPDPIYIAIDAARLADLPFVLCKADERVPEGALEELADATAALARTVPTTPAGFAALTAFLREAHGNLHGAGAYFDDADDAAAFAKSLDLAVRGMAGLKPWQGVPMVEAATDPIFAAIETHRRAHAAFIVAIDARSAAEDRLKHVGAKMARAKKKCGYTQAVQEYDAAIEVEDDALRQLVATVPTTADGIHAALDYRIEMHAHTGDHVYTGEVVEFLSSIRRAVRLLALHAPTPEGSAT